MPQECHDFFSTRYYYYLARRLLSIIYNRRGTNYTIYVYIPNTFSRLLVLLLLYANYPAAVHRYVIVYYTCVLFINIFFFFIIENLQSV